MAKRARPKASRVDRRARRPASRNAKPSRPALPAERSKPAPPSGLDAQAVALYQQGLVALQRHAYQPAAEAFRALVERFPTERALLERTRVYLDLCQRELGRRPANPRTLEERLTAATAALNNGEDAQAERLLKTVLAEHSRHDLALYLMAAIEARRGDADAAMSYLSQAVGVSPEVRAQARHDADFEALRHSEAFQTLIDPPAGQSGARRTRRSR